MLGKGLESLIPPSDNNESDENISRSEAPATPAIPQPPKPASTKDAIFHIEVDLIEPNPEQPRRDFNEEALHELASSIREFGVIQPIVVSKVEQVTAYGQTVSYRLIAGERRWRASKLAGLTTIPAIIRQSDVRREQLELAIIENLQRENLNPIESARAFARLQDEFRLTQREIATRLGKSREVVANTIRLLNLPTFIQEAIVQNLVNESQGRLLLTVTDIGSQERLFQELLRSNLSVRELRSKIQEANAPLITPPVSSPVDHEILVAMEQLELLLGTPVKVERSGETGKIVINFFSPEELRGIISRLTPQEKTSEDSVDHFEGFTV